MTTLRTASPADWPAVLHLEENAFGQTMTEDQRAVERSVLEPERTLLAEDGATPVATATVFSLRMTLPGGPHPVAGVSGVAVLPTHRRRGLLTALMDAQLRGLHDQGLEPVAVLWGSEAAIYGRYGYGCANRQLDLTVRRRPDALTAAATALALDAGVELALVPPAASHDLAEPVYDAVRARRPGLHERDARWRARETADEPGVRDGESELRCVLASDASGPRAYARYRVREQRDTGGFASVVQVRELFGSDPGAYAAVLRYLLDLDLTAAVSLPLRPLDDPLIDLLGSVRGAGAQVREGLYARLVDVDRALAARAYAGEVDVVLEVLDERCPWNAGRWRLTAGPGGATCERTSAAPDLTLPVAALGAAHLGSPGTLARLGRAGLLVEHRGGALCAASLAFSGELEPWGPVVW